MLLAFIILSCSLFVDFSSVSARKIVKKPPPTASPHQHDGEVDPLQKKAGHHVLKHLHQVYHSDMQKKDDDLHQLLVLKHQYILRNHLEEFEIDFALNFVPDWSKVDRWSSTARQGIEIRRQKWEYILEKHSDVPTVQSLADELSKSGVNQSTFCKQIAEAYFILSHNQYIYIKGPKPNENGHKVSDLVQHPVMDKSLKIFMRTLPDSEFKFNETEELVQIPKSVYHNLLRKDAQITLLKKHHESEIKQQHGGRHSKNGHKHSDHHDDTETTSQSQSPETPTESTTSTTDSEVTTCASSSSESSDSVLDTSESSDTDININIDTDTDINTDTDTNTDTDINTDTDTSDSSGNDSDDDDSSTVQVDDSTSWEWSSDSD